MKKTFSIILSFFLFGVLLLGGFTIISKGEEIELNSNEKDATKQFIVCIDAGHQQKGDFKTEPISPGAGERKARVSAGATGIATKKPEYVINLETALLLKNILIEKGYEVVMTREKHEINISNVERAQIANNSKADITIRLHCDYISDPNKSGTVILVPSKNGEHTKEIYEPSSRFAEILKKHLKGNGIIVNGIFERSDITGFNWSKTPVIILEMGFISNWNEDKMLNDVNYQNKLMTIISDAIEQYKLEV